jgi:DNA-binding transcriptional LysR family regulator
MDRFLSMTNFIRVVEAGSFSEAARQLGVGQPAVSKLIAQLEEHLGVQLLLRSSRGLTPTEAGQNFFERAKCAIEEADEAELAARGAGATLTGRLRVSAAVTFTRIHIVPKLGEFVARHPGLEIELILDDRTVDLVEEGIDVALRMGNLADSSSTARRLAKARRRVIGTSAYFEKRGMPAHPDELAHHDAIVYMQGDSVVWPFKKGTQTRQVALNSRVRTTAAEALRAAVLADLGLAVASDWMFAEELKSGKALEALTDWTLPSVALWALFPTGRRVSAKARAFVSFVEEQL